MGLRCLILGAAALLLQAGQVFAGDRILPVPAVTIYPGDLIGEEQIIERAFPLAAAGKVSVIEERPLLVGKIARRTLLPGKPIPLNGVREPDVITRGGSVIAVYQAGTLTITSLVSPLKAGAAGDVIEARNIDSGQIIRGTIQPDGTIRVGSSQ